MEISDVKKFLSACQEAKRITELMPPLPKGMSPRHIYVIDAVFQLSQCQEQVMVSDVSKLLGVTRPSITKVIQELEKLKVHPREVTENKLLLNRLMTLCEESSPKDREYFAGLIALFEKTLEDQDPRKIKRCREQIQKSIANFSDREIFDDFDFWGEIYGGGDDGEEQEEKPEEDLDFMEFSKKWTN